MKKCILAVPCLFIVFSVITAPSREDIFNKIFATNAWNNKESVSGEGSTLKQTQFIRSEIPRIIDLFEIKTMLDIPCGDFNWMKTVDSNLERYIGADIVLDLVKSNQEKYGSDARSFYHLDVTCDDLPTVDLIMCRDCLVHLSDEDVFLAINNMKKSKSKYLLATTFTKRKSNRKIVTGSWRPMNFIHPPFNFPKPILIINEKCPRKDYPDKSLGLWKIEDLPSK